MERSRFPSFGVFERKHEDEEIRGKSEIKSQGTRGQEIAGGESKRLQEGEQVKEMKEKLRGVMEEEGK